METGAMIQQLTLTALLEVESSTPSADMASHYHIQPWFQEITCPVRAWTSTGQMWVKKLTHIKNKIIIIKFKNKIIIS